jgi:hypothetical protein
LQFSSHGKAATAAAAADKRFLLEESGLGEEGLVTGGLGQRLGKHVQLGPAAQSVVLLHERKVILALMYKIPYLNLSFIIKYKKKSAKEAVLWIRIH